MEFVKLVYFLFLFLFYYSSLYYASSSSSPIFKSSTASENLPILPSLKEVEEKSEIFLEKLKKNSSGTQKKNANENIGEILFHNDYVQFIEAKSQFSLDGGFIYFEVISSEIKTVFLSYIKDVHLRKLLAQSLSKKIKNFLLENSSYHHRELNKLSYLIHAYLSEEIIDAASWEFYIHNQAVTIHDSHLTFLENKLSHIIFRFSNSKIEKYLRASAPSSFAFNALIKDKNFSYHLNSFSLSIENFSGIPQYSLNHFFYYMISELIQLSKTYSVSNPFAKNTFGYYWYHFLSGYNEDKLIFEKMNYLYFETKESMQNFNKNVYRNLLKKIPNFLSEENLLKKLRFNLIHKHFQFSFNLNLNLSVMNESCTFINSYNADANALESCALLFFEMLKEDPENPLKIFMTNYQEAFQYALYTKPNSPLNFDEISDQSIQSFFSLLVSSDTLQKKLKNKGIPSFVEDTLLFQNLNFISLLRKESYVEDKHQLVLKVDPSNFCVEGINALCLIFLKASLTNVNYSGQTLSLSFSHSFFKAENLDNINAFKGHLNEKFWQDILNLNPDSIDFSYKSELYNSILNLSNHFNNSPNFSLEKFMVSNSKRLDSATNQLAVSIIMEDLEACSYENISPSMFEQCANFLAFSFLKAQEGDSLVYESKQDFNFRLYQISFTSYVPIYQINLPRDFVIKNFSIHMEAYIKFIFNNPRSVYREKMNFFHRKNSQISNFLKVHDINRIENYVQLTLEVEYLCLYDNEGLAVKDFICHYFIDVFENMAIEFSREVNDRVSIMINFINYTKNFNPDFKIAENAQIKLPAFWLELIDWSEFWNEASNFNIFEGSGGSRVSALLHDIVRIELSNQNIRIKEVRPNLVGKNLIITLTLF